MQLYIDNHEAFNSLLEKSYVLKGQNQLKSRAKEILSILESENYLEAHIDSIYFDSINQEYHLSLFKGPLYDFELISLDSIDQDLKDKLDYPLLRNKNEFLDFRKRTIAILGNQGYPFAKLHLDNHEAGWLDSLSYLSINPGPQIVVDSLRINGNVKLSKKYLENFLNIKQGSLYHHTRVSNIKNNLGQLGFLEQYADPTLTFFGSYATVDLYLNARNASRFDFLFGIIPTSSFSDRSLFVSFDLTAEMRNKLGSGEYFYVDFERLRPEQQKFQFKFNYPYLLGLKYGLDIDFSIFRLSLDYQTLSSDIGLEYLINNTDKLKLSWNYESSNLVEVDTTSLLSTGLLPEDLDVSQNGIAVALNISRLDYPFNPRKGYAIQLKTAAGLKKIKQNTSILQLQNENYDFSNAYDSLSLRSTRFEAKADIRNFLPISIRNTIATYIQMGWRYSESGLYRNEKFQIGGNKLLRGFDEARFFTSWYGISTIEHRILLSNNSYLNAPFLDFGYLDGPDNQKMWAMGIGGGLGIETNAGVFTFSIAVGRTKEQDFDLRRPKAHLGFVSIF